MFFYYESFIGLVVWIIGLTGRFILLLHLEKLFFLNEVCYYGGKRNVVLL